MMMFAGDHDSRSVGGHIIVSPVGIISWLARRLSTISTSTSHAETQAFFGVVKEIVYLRAVIADIPLANSVLSSPTVTHGDSSACLELVRKDTGIKPRARHWKMNWNWQGVSSYQLTLSSSWDHIHDHYSDYD